MSSFLFSTFVLVLIAFSNADTDNNEDSNQQVDSCPLVEDSFTAGYAHYVIHEIMLSDRIRTGTYHTAIVDNPQLFKDKIVLDIGSGTGILSLFAAKAGAKSVYSIEMSSMATYAEQIVAENNYSHVIHIINGKVEEIELPVPTVDVIIAEWMGYFLLFESVYPSVLYARDKWLVDGGIIMPDKFELFLCAIEDEVRFNKLSKFWGNVYGFSMRSLQKRIEMDAVIDVFHPIRVVTECSLIHTMDLNTLPMVKNDENYTSDFQLLVEKDTKVHAILTYFDVYFSQCGREVGFSTSPLRYSTHWQQTAFYLDEEFVRVKKGDYIQGNIQFAPNETFHRLWDVNMTVQHVEGDVVKSEQRIKRRVGN